VGAPSQGRLKEVEGLAPILENLATASLTVLALALTIVAARAYLATRSRKVLLLSLGFGLFLVKGVVLSVGLFTTVDWENRFLLPSLLMDLVALALFYGAVLKRSGT
jgi:hypothetical protein